jgi:Domain of unknown function (DUF1905)
MPHTFTAQLWIWDARKSDSWTFATVPPELSDDLRERIGPRGGFGSIPVEVTIGASTWRTSVFPDKESGCFVLPIKSAVRKAEAISAGDKAEISLKTV